MSRSRPVQNTGVNDGSRRSHAPAAISRKSGKSSSATLTRDSWARKSAAAHQKPECAVGFAMLDQRIAGLPREGFEVAHARRVGGDDANHLAALHVVERFLGAQDR